MQFRQIEAFRAVMQSGSASRAAELLDVSQPAVSRSIAELERNLGFSLFERISGRLHPTPEGRLFLAEVDRSFVGLDRLKAEAARIRDFGVGQLRIASHAAVGATLVPRAIHLFHKSNPDIPITLQIQSTAQVRELIAHGGFDLGLAADEIDLTGLEHRKFQGWAAICAIPASHRLAGHHTITPEDLDGERFIALAPEDHARHRLEAVFQQRNVRPKVIVETPSSSTVCALALAELGIGIVNPASIDGFRERGLMFRPFVPQVYFQSIMVFRPDMLKTRLVKEMAGAMLKARAQTNVG